MAGTYHPIPSIPLSDDTFPQPVTALSFDPVADTLWAGLNNGSIVATYGAAGVRGVRFPVGGRLAVKQIIANDSNVRAYGISSNGVGAWNKGGMNKWYFQTSTAVTAFSNNASNASVFYACTAAQDFLTINAQTGTEVRKSAAVSIFNHLVHTHSALVSSSADGYVRTHDTRSHNSTVHSTKAHLSGVSGLEAGGNFIYTIGNGTRQGRPFPDPLVKVYDVRTMRSLPPIPFNGPSFINKMPNRSSTIVITSTEGLVNVVDVSNPTDSEFYQIPISSLLTSVAISPTATYMAFGDSDSLIHLMTAVEDGVEMPFNGFDGMPGEMAAPLEIPPDIEWTVTTPLNTIGMPYYDTLLLSSWTSKLLPSDMVSPPPPKIPQQILETMKVNDNVAYAALPKELKGRRNVVATERRKGPARFRSGKPSMDPEPDTPTYEYDPEAIPKPYRKVEIEYSKFGVEDFDFAFYNKTDYSGLETHILNSYTNAMVQLLHYTHPVRHLAKSHITTDCQREHCLFCELGFVFRMLEDAKGTNCQASNFCKTVGVMAHSYNIELVDYGRETADTNYSTIIQSFHRFLIENLSAEGNAYPHNPSLLPVIAHQPYPAAAPITQLFGLDAKTVVVCTNCQATREKESMTHMVDLTYPRKPNGDIVEGSDFPSILRSSLLRQATHKASCPSCGKAFATFDSRKSFPSKDLPPILAVNASAMTEEHIKYWKDTRQQTFLKPQIELCGQVNGIDDPEPVTYELRGLIAQVIAKDKYSHLVSLVKVPEAEASPDPEADSPWYIFNDFSVRNITEEEALSFPSSWKVPAILYLERVDLRTQLDFSSLPNQLNTHILSQDTNISLNRDPNLIRHQELRYDELPKPGTLVAIDAEFVSMQQEETEYRSDGTKKVLRPPRLSLARVSVLRGDGPLEGIPFIDDHIHTSEMIVDYLTEFSGIKFGDLDPRLSPYTLTPLKTVYKKLRLLVDRGCIFIGHGLSKDFRIINIFVPPEQVLDTVDVYFVYSRQRRLSLRFLTWFVLEETIQTDTHDSIEDALSALRLYKEFQRLESEGTFDAKLEELYREGRQYNFKPPQLEEAAGKTTTQSQPPKPPARHHNQHLSSPPAPLPPFMMHPQNAMAYVPGAANPFMFAGQQPQQQQYQQHRQQQNWRHR